jgi:hypothetical protein
MTVRDDLTITLVGDIMPGGILSERYDELRERILPEEARPWFDSDIVFANLECVASNAGLPLPDKIVTYCLPEALDVLGRLNVHVVSLANNHQMDYGIEGSEATQALLDARGVRHAGVGRNIAGAWRPVVLERKGRRVAFLCFSWTTEFVEPVPAATEDRAGVSPYDERAILDSIGSVRRSHAPDVTVVSIHWGEGKSHYARPECVRAARRFIEAGADVVVGHHAHCLQGYEMHHGKPIFYGLGNFLCSAYRKTADKRLTYGEGGTYRYRWLRERKTLVARVTIPDEGPIRLDVLPLLQLDDPPVLVTPPPAAAQSILDEVERYSRRLQGPDYARWTFALYRRLDEAQRVIEDLREKGWRREYFSPSAALRVARKLIRGRSFH